jgi:hypothetical protein
MDHLDDIHFQVKQCELIVFHAHTIQVFDPMAHEDMYLHSRAVIEFSYVLYLPIVHGLHS